jgi:hypothetical protein
MWLVIKQFLITTIIVVERRQEHVSSTEWTEKCVITFLINRVCFYVIFSIGGNWKITLNWNNWKHELTTEVDHTTPHHTSLAEYLKHTQREREREGRMVEDTTHSY